MSERVDKSWHTKGLETYSLEAILGTLQHYGVTCDEAGYLALAKEDFPLNIAARWHEQWKGTGQFSRFPAAASEELWRRLCAPQIAPTDVALALVNLVTDLDAVAEGKPDEGTLDTRFKVIEAYLPSFPTEPTRREKFVAELTAAMGEWLEAFDALPEALVKAKHLELAERVVKLEEAVFPVRSGISTAHLRVLRGEEAAGLADLVVIANDASRNDFNRLAAVDALLEHEALDDAQRVLLALVDKAQQTKDVELASGAVELLTELLHLDVTPQAQQEIRARVNALAEAFGDGED